MFGRTLLIALLVISCLVTVQARSSHHIKTLQRRHKDVKVIYTQVDECDRNYLNDEYDKKGGIIVGLQKMQTKSIPLLGTEEELICVIEVQYT